MNEKAFVDKVAEYMQTTSLGEFTVHACPGVRDWLNTAAELIKDSPYPDPMLDVFCHALDLCVSPSLAERVVLVVSQYVWDLER